MLGNAISSGGTTTITTTTTTTTTTNKNNKIIRILHSFTPLTRNYLLFWVFGWKRPISVDWVPMFATWKCMVSLGCELKQVTAVLPVRR